MSKPSGKPRCSGWNGRQTAEGVTSGRRQHAQRYSAVLLAVPLPTVAVAAARGSSSGRCGGRQCPDARGSWAVMVPADARARYRGMKAPSSTADPLRWVTRDSGKARPHRARHGNLAAARQPQVEQKPYRNSAPTM